MKIALIADTHVAPGATAFNQNCESIRDWVESLRPDFTIHLGDITADAAKYPEQLATAAAVFNRWNCKVHFLPGNHDIGDNQGDMDGRDPQVTDERLALFQRIFGPDHWSLICQNWTLLGINAQLIGNCSEAEAKQLAWLESVLGHAAGPIGLMLHKPLFRNGPGDREKHYRYLPYPARQSLLDLLAGKDLRFVVSGHTHQARRFHIDSTEHIWVPSAAFFIPDCLQEQIGDKIVGAMVLTLSESDYKFDLIVPHGCLQHDVLDHAYVYPQLSSMLAAHPAAGFGP